MSPGTEQWQQSGQYFRFRGHKIFFRRQGADGAPKLVLIHGFPTSSYDWHPLWSALCEQFDVLCLDMLGFGFSDKPYPHDYSIYEQADIVEALLEEQAFSSCHLLAHDYGDTVTQELLARDNARSDARIQSALLSNGGLFPECHRPVLLQKLLLSPLGFLVARLASFSRFESNFNTICARPLEEQDLKNLWQLTARAEGRRAMPGIIRYITERAENRERWVGALQSYRGPIRFINGVEDPISGEHMAQRFETLVSKGELVRMPGVGHYPQLEAPAEFLTIAQEFWTRLI